MRSSERSTASSSAWLSLVRVVLAGGSHAWLLSSLPLLSFLSSPFLLSLLSLFSLLSPSSLSLFFLSLFSFLSTISEGGCSTSSCGVGYHLPSLLSSLHLLSLFSSPFLLLSLSSLSLSTPFLLVAAPLSASRVPAGVPASCWPRARGVPPPPGGSFFLSSLPFSHFSHLSPGFPFTPLSLPSLLSLSPWTHTVLARGLRSIACARSLVLLARRAGAAASVLGMAD